MPNYTVTVEEIEKILPQTQCRECGYSGCLPYAKAIVNQSEKISLCAPGGIDTLKKLAEKLEVSADVYINEVKSNYLPPQLAFIREEECIGCTKCIQACPVDAIIGTAKMMHTIISDECTGCGLCVPACPVDCIDLNAIPAPIYNPELARKRFMERESRLKAAAKQQQLTKLRENNLTSTSSSSKKSLIEAALARVNLKKSKI